jgi:hypothetical protein
MAGKLALCEVNSSKSTACNTAPEPGVATRAAEAIAKRLNVKIFRALRVDDVKRL